MSDTVYSFCESAHATGHGHWHIRKLTAKGQMFGGGADTPSLCGTKVAWDLEVELTPFHMDNNTCINCRKKFYREDKMTALFVAVEGADCCGKGTQTKYLADKLEAKTFKFPDKETPIGEIIYEHLFQNWKAAPYHEGPHDQAVADRMEYVDALMFQCMQMANRLEHARAINSALVMGRNVVSDRYIASGVVYGGHDGLDPEYIHDIQKYLPQPDLNILLDIDVEDAVERMKGRGDTPDRYENAETLGKIIGRYREHWVEMRQYEGDYRWVVVDARKSSVEVAAEIATVVKAFKARTA